MTSATQKAYDQGLAEGRAESRGEGQLAERERIKTILESSQAAGRPTLAKKLALDTDLDADAAQSALAVAPIEDPDAYARTLVRDAGVGVVQ